jgi:hypothetical protein
MILLAYPTVRGGGGQPILFHSRWAKVGYGGPKSAQSLDAKSALICCGRPLQLGLSQDDANVRAEKTAAKSHQAASDAGLGVLIQWRR